MNTAFAIDYIPRRMKELGYENAYITRWRHLQIDAGSILKINADNEYFLLIEPSADFMVKSKMGIYDVRDQSINEMQYEHRGKIHVQNFSSQSRLILFIQIIPNHQY